MNRNWTALIAGLALLAVGPLTAAAATEPAKAAPAAAATEPAKAVPAAPAAHGAHDTHSTPAPASRGKAPANKMPAAPKKNLVNLNAASAKQLKALPGGSDEEAQRIIAGRPYGSKAFLLSNKVISEARYAEINKLVVAGTAAKTTKSAAK